MSSRRGAPASLAVGMPTEPGNCRGAPPTCGHVQLGCLAAKSSLPLQRTTASRAQPRPRLRRRGAQRSRSGGGAGGFARRSTRQTEQPTPIPYMPLWLAPSGRVKSLWSPFGVAEVEGCGSRSSIVTSAMAHRPRRSPDVVEERSIVAIYKEEGRVAGVAAVALPERRGRTHGN